jgi:hypothetical protein
VFGSKEQVQDQGQLTTINQDRKFSSSEGGDKLFAGCDVRLASQVASIDAVLTEGVRQIPHMRHVDTKN